MELAIRLLGRPSWLITLKLRLRTRSILARNWRISTLQQVWVRRQQISSNSSNRPYTQYTRIQPIVWKVKSLWSSMYSLIPATISFSHATTICMQTTVIMMPRMLIQICAQMFRAYSRWTLQLTTSPLTSIEIQIWVDQSQFTSLTPTIISISLGAWALIASRSGERVHWQIIFQVRSPRLTLLWQPSRS